MKNGFLMFEKSWTICHILSELNPILFVERVLMVSGIKIQLIIIAKLTFKHYMNCNLTAFSNILL